MRKTYLEKLLHAFYQNCFLVLFPFFLVAPPFSLPRCLSLFSPSLTDLSSILIGVGPPIVDKVPVEDEVGVVPIMVGDIVSK